MMTIGHSTLTQDEFSELLDHHGVKAVFDVRSMPGSNRFPHFNQEAMRTWLPVPYVHLPGLGGRRKFSEIDPQVNAGWTHASFHNYADYGFSYAYSKGLMALEVGGEDIAFMCSEAVPWRCHRQVIATSMVFRGWQVDHIVGKKLVRHELGQWGPAPLMINGVVRYPKEYK
jgi:uncharacterized protein (DUF488 family)